MAKRIVRKIVRSSGDGTQVSMKTERVPLGIWPFQCHGGKRVCHKNKKKNHGMGGKRGRKIGLQKRWVETKKSEDYSIQG